MKLRNLVPALALIALTSQAIAEETYINLGPSFFTFRGKEKGASSSTEQKGLYCGVRAEVERSQPDSLYLGFMGVYAPGAQTAYHELATQDGSSASMKVSSYLGHAEARIGKHYQLADKTDFIPFVGVGMYHVNSMVKMKAPEMPSEASSELIQDWAYATFGFAANYPVNEMLQVGLIAKALRHGYSNMETVVNGESVDTKMHSRWGYEVSMPVTVKPSATSIWTLLAEPFLLKVDTSKAVNVMGARISIQRGF